MLIVSRDLPKIYPRELFWLQLEECERDAARVLLYTQVLWDNGTPHGDIVRRCWEDLSVAELHAAFILGYYSASWNDEVYKELSEADTQPDEVDFMTRRCFPWASVRVSMRSTNRLTAKRPSSRSRKVCISVS